MGFIEGPIMSQNVKCDHFKPVENADQDLKYVAVKGFTEPFPEMGKSSFAGDPVSEAGVFPVAGSLFLIPHHFQELVHVFKPFHMPEQVS